MRRRGLLSDCLQVEDVDDAFPNWRAAEGFTHRDGLSEARRSPVLGLYRPL